MNEDEKAADRAGHFEAVLNQIVFLLERDDPGREGQHPTKSDRAVALSMAKSALAYDAKTHRPATPLEQTGALLAATEPGENGIRSLAGTNAYGGRVMTPEEIAEYEAKLALLNEDGEVL